MPTQIRNIAKLSLNTSESVKEYANSQFACRPLCTLLFLMQYSSDNVSSSILGILAETFRQWVWLTIDEISSKANQAASKKKI